MPSSVLPKKKRCRFPFLRPHWLSEVGAAVTAFFIAFPCPLGKSMGQPEEYRERHFDGGVELLLKAMKDSLCAYW